MAAVSWVFQSRWFSTKTTRSNFQVFDRVFQRRSLLVYRQRKVKTFSSCCAHFRSVDNIFSVQIATTTVCITRKMHLYSRDQARGRLGRNYRPGGRNFALNGTQGEVGVSLKKKKKKKKIFFFLGRLISFCHHTNASCGDIIRQSTTTASCFSFHLMAIVCVMADLLLKWQKMS